MQRCYELFILQESVRKSNGRISSSRLFTEIHPDAEECGGVRGSGHGKMLIIQL